MAGQPAITETHVAAFHRAERVVNSVRATSTALQHGGEPEREARDSEIRNSACDCESACEHMRGRKDGIEAGAGQSHIG